MGFYVASSDALLLSYYLFAGLTDATAASKMSDLINTTVQSAAFTDALVAAGLPKYTITVTGAPTIVQLGDLVPAASSTNTTLIIGKSSP
jgi:hypothetical protein